MMHRYANEVRQEKMKKEYYMKHEIYVGETQGHEDWMKRDVQKLSDNRNNDEM